MKRYVTVWWSSLTGIFKNGDVGMEESKGIHMYTELACFWLCSLIGFGLASLEKFVGLCGGIDEVFRVPDHHIRKMEGLSPRFKQEILKTRDISRLEKEYNKLSQRGISFIGQGHKDFPQKLKVIPECPFGLFLTGTLPSPDKPSVAIVGARGATVFGQETARNFAKVLSLHGIQIISGLALGIDGYAHRGVLEAGQCTWAVLGCGINICYPKENIRIFEQIKERGGLVSEFLPGQEPLPWHFPFRNRIISGLADGILVVEARKRSGSLITAGFGLDQGKDIYAVPGRPTDALSAGCNSLIADGAKLVTRPEDILEDYKISVKNFAEDKFMLDNLEKLVYPSLCLDAKSIEQIAAQTCLDYAQTARTLVSLVHKGCARQVGKNYYIRRG